MTESAVRPTAVATHDLREHVRRGAEGDGVHEAAVDGEVEDDLGRAEVEPGGTGAVTDEDRERGRCAAVEERRHLVAARDLPRCADQHRGVVSGHGDAGCEQSKQPVEVTVLGRGHEGVDHFPFGQAVLQMGLGDLGPCPRGQLARGRRRGVQDRRDRPELETEAVVQHEGNPLARGEPVEHHLQGEADGLRERDVVGRIADGRLELDVAYRDGGP